MSDSRMRRAAFFDVDNTLLDLKSMFSFQAFYWQQRPEPGLSAQMSYQRFIARLQAHPQHDDRQALNRLFYESFAGRSHTDVLMLGRQWFDTVHARMGERLWIASAVRLAHDLGALGFERVAVSGSCEAILAPVLAFLRFEGALVTQLEQIDGRYTGKIVPPQVIGAGKAEVIERYLQAQGMAAGDCVACGDHISDAPMLQTTGRAFVVPGDDALERLAAERGWGLLAPPGTSSAPASPDLPQERLFV